MSWDQKGVSGPYFYQSVREGDRVRKLYVGKGERAQELAREVEQSRRERQEARAAWQSEQAQVAAAEQALQDLRHLADLLVRAVLVSQGYHEHRSQWRRRHARDGNQRQGRSQA